MYIYILSCVISYNTRQHLLAAGFLLMFSFVLLQFYCWLLCYSRLFFTFDQHVFCDFSKDLAKVGQNSLLYVKLLNELNWALHKLLSSIESNEPTLFWHKSGLDMTFLLAGSLQTDPIFVSCSCNCSSFVEVQKSLNIFLAACLHH